MRRIFLIIALLILSMPVSVVAQRSVESVKSSEVMSIDGHNYYIHQVRPGETLSGISRAYGVGIADIQEDNPVLRDGLKAGQTLRIKAGKIPEVRMSRRQYIRTFDEHIVAPGETAYSIARRYLLSIQTLIEDNPGLDPSNIRAGQKIKIRKSETGETSPDAIRNEISSMSTTLNRLSEDYYYYVVDIGETIYSLSRRWKVDESVIRQHNDVSQGLRAGQMIKIPVEGREELKQHLVDVPLYFTDDKQVQQYRYEGVLKVAMLMPLWDENGMRTNFIEFYQGALIALGELKTEGYSIDFSLYDTGRSQEVVREIVRSGALDAVDLIIGPVYEDEIMPVMELANRREIPVVSPLSTMAGRYNELLYQMAPSADTRYAKMKGLFGGDKNVAFFVTEDNDDDFEREMADIMGPVYYQRVNYTKDLPGEYIDSLVVKRSMDNLFVVTARNEVGVDQVLATLSSIQNNRLARSIRTGPIQVIGNSRWMRHQMVDRNLFFKLNVTFSTTYHSDRSDEKVNGFDKRYIEAFSSIPSLYSYRGYDAVKMFAGAMLTGDPANHFADNLNAAGQPLQTRYVFEKSPGGFFVNTNWPLVTYRNDYTISVK